MKLATTTSDFEGYNLSIEQIVDIYAKTNFRHIDCGIEGDFIQNNPAFFQSGWEYETKKLLEYANKRGILFVQAHSPIGKPLLKDENYENFIFTTKRSIEISALLGIKNIVVHSGYLPNISKEECFEKNKKFYEELLILAEKYNVNILTENFNKMCINGTYWVDSAKDEKELVEYVNHPLFHACWDTGHGNLQETTQFEALNILGKDVYALHVQDNFGKQDQHLAPFCGCMDMDSLMRGLNNIGYKGYFTFESTNFFLPKSMRKEQFADGVLKSPSLEIKGLSENLLYEIGKYVLTSYKQYEE